MTVAKRPASGHQSAYTPAELPDLLRVGRDKVYELLRTGRLRSVRVGRRYLIPSDAVADFFKQAQ